MEKLTAESLLRKQHLYERAGRDSAFRQRLAKVHHLEAYPDTDLISHYQNTSRTYSVFIEKILLDKVGNK